MNWLNLKTTQLREPPFIGSEPVARATWLCVMAYCVELENGGRIQGARLWKDRQWQQTCGVMLSEVLSAALLLTWEGDDLIVWSYPYEKQVEVLSRRETAQQNGKRGGRPKGETTEKITNEKPTLVSENNQRCKAEGEGEGEGERKEKGKEGEGKNNCSEPEEPAAEPEPEPILIFPCVGPVKTWNLTEQKLGEWQETYPGMDVGAAARAARQWCIDNPQKRKTARGMTRFVGNWLSSAQNKGEHRRGSNSAPIAYWTPTHPDAFRPTGEMLREDFKKNFGADPKGAAIIAKIDAMENGDPAPK